MNSENINNWNSSLQTKATGLANLSRKQGFYEGYALAYINKRNQEHGLKERAPRLTRGSRSKGSLASWLLRMSQLQTVSIIISLRSGRGGDCGPGRVTWRSLCREGEGWVTECKRAAACIRGGVSHRKIKCWVGKITNPCYNKERSPVPSQMPSLVTLW